jgi:hypothetical protein
VGPQVAVAKAVRQVSEVTEGVQQGHDARVAEAKGGGALRAHATRPLQALERLDAQAAVVPDPLDFQELAIDLLPEAAELPEVSPPFADVEVARRIEEGIRGGGYPRSPRVLACECAASPLPPASRIWVPSSAASLAAEEACPCSDSYRGPASFPEGLVDAILFRQGRVSMHALIASAAAGASPLASSDRDTARMNVRCS